MRSLGHYANDQQVIGIVRRFDSNADQVVHMEEFLEIMTPNDRKVVDMSTSLPHVMARGHSPQRMAIRPDGRISPIRARSGSPLRHGGMRSGTASKSVRF